MICADIVVVVVVVVIVIVVVVEFVRNAMSAQRLNLRRWQSLGG